MTEEADEGVHEVQLPTLSANFGPFQRLEEEIRRCLALAAESSQKLQKAVLAFSPFSQLEI